MPIDVHAPPHNRLHGGFTPERRHRSAVASPETSRSWPPSRLTAPSPKIISPISDWPWVSACVVQYSRISSRLSVLPSPGYRFAAAMINGRRATGSPAQPQARICTTARDRQGAARPRGRKAPRFHRLRSPGRASPGPSPRGSGSRLRAPLAGSAMRLSGSSEGGGRGKGLGAGAINLRNPLEQILAIFVV